jgi:hypothetical protein
MQTERLEIKVQCGVPDCGYRDGFAAPGGDVDAAMVGAKELCARMVAHAKNKHPEQAALAEHAAKACQEIEAYERRANSHGLPAGERPR